jgi:hypothetical protein
MKCPRCDTEIPATGKFCAECGAPLPGQEGRERADHFKTLVAFLIAFVSVAGAVLAYRAALAAGDAADADIAGVISSVNLHHARAASEADLYRDLKAYLQARIHDQLGRHLAAERDQYPEADPARDLLWDQAWIETQVAEAYLSRIYVNPESVRADGTYDEQAALDIAIAHRALETDLEPEVHFAEADRLRTKVQWMVGLAALLALTLLFYTLAQIITHWVKFLFLALGSGTFIVAVIAVAAVELIL